MKRATRSVGSAYLRCRGPAERRPADKARPRAAAPACGQQALEAWGRSSVVEGICVFALGECRACLLEAWPPPQTPCRFGLCCENGVKGLAVWRASLALGPSLRRRRATLACEQGAVPRGRAPFREPMERVEASHLQKQLECRETVRLSGGAGGGAPSRRCCLCLRRPDGGRAHACARSGQTASATLPGSPTGSSAPPFITPPRRLC